MASVGNGNGGNANAPAQSESYPMVGGDGEYSYARNSSQQRVVVQGSKDFFAGIIAKNFDLKTDQLTFRIADFGCSIGPNTFESMNIIIEAIQHKYKLGLVPLVPVPVPIPEPEFMAFFNDHVTNDFNSLFVNLPEDRRYFPTGVPGSFHGRLFPENSLDVVYSSCSLHWLSKLPKGLSDPDSPAYNKDRIFCVNAPAAVGDAYSAQFLEDMDSFLDARGRELIPGGLMLLIVPGRETGTAPSDYVAGGRVIMYLETILVDMAKEGVVSEKQMESFNMPLYYPSPEELTATLQKNPRLEILELNCILYNQNSSPAVYSKGAVRAGFEGLLLKYFGDEIVEQAFRRYEEKISSFEVNDLGHPKARRAALLVALRRKF